MRSEYYPYFRSLTGQIPAEGSPKRGTLPGVFADMGNLDWNRLRNIMNGYIPAYRKELVLKISFFFDMDGTVNYWDENGNIYAPHYFRQCRPMWNLIKAIALLKAYGLHCYFGTAVIDSRKDMMEDKKAWIKEVGLERVPPIFIPYGENKDDYLLGDYKFLLDDHTPNLEKFSGGCAKYLNGVNHRGKKWKGATIDMNETPLIMALKIIDYACKEYEKRA